MINYNPDNWNLIFLFKGTIIKRLLGGMFFIVILSTVLCFLHIKLKVLNLEVGAAMPGYMGAALGLLLVFRNNTAYDKWWEARKCLGELVNTSRNFAITINNILPKSSGERSSLYRLLIGYTFAVKEHLREGVKLEELKMVEASDMQKIIAFNHKPNGIANIMQNKVVGLHKNNQINDMQQYHLINNICTLIDIVGKCERIKKTPIPIAYAFLLKFFIVIYVVMLPFGLLDTLGWSLIPVTVMVYYIMMSIVLTAEEIEDPFGHHLNDLPVDEIAKNIERNIIEIMSAELKPVSEESLV
jgi:ion channel-forming bestrophin family protein